MTLYNKLNEKRNLTQKRSYFVVKDNQLVQQARYGLSLQQQKLLLVMISKIKRLDEPETWYEMTIKEFCELFGANETSGRNYTMIKAQLKSLADTSFWMPIEGGKETLFRWFDGNGIIISEGNGKIQYKFGKSATDYLFDLWNRYTQYELVMILGMQSKYSIRLYELCASYRKTGEFVITVDELHRIMDVTGKSYEVFSHLKQKVLDVAVDEINRLTDIKVTYICEKKGTKTIAVRFFVENQNGLALVKNGEERKRVLNKDARRRWRLKRKQLNQEGRPEE